MTKPFKPMLAATYDGTLRHDDYLLSPKFDGIRCIIRNGQPVSRSLKTIPNVHVQEILSHPELEGMDGELIVGRPNDPDVYRNTNSGVMKKAGEPDFKFFVFDIVPEDLRMPFSERFQKLKERFKSVTDTFECLHLVVQVPIDSETILEEEETYWTNLGYEGVMIRRASSLYKFGRATPKAGELLKVKRFETAEAVIIGFEPLMKNENEATTNALGHTERSSHQSGKVAQDMLGNLLVVEHGVDNPVPFSIGSGFTMAEREQLWADRGNLKGKIVSYQHFPVGRLNLPRFPTWRGLRDERDMS